MTRCWLGLLKLQFHTKAGSNSVETDKVRYFHLFQLKHNWHLGRMYLFHSPPPLFNTFLPAAEVFALQSLLQVAVETGVFVEGRMVAALRGEKEELCVFNNDDNKLKG